MRESAARRNFGRRPLPVADFPFTVHRSPFTR